MSRVPPGLLYLTIYNPTIKHSGPIIGDEEDAEEQAQILFYTARERAVSRDKILRQVGLAKALVNFTGLFSSSDVCENTHSQSRRMVMVSPEPDFWIHACIELARSPRPAPAKGKGKSIAKAPATQEVVYDYHDPSIHDLCLRMRILRGYEQFKLTHGSFASILASLGQQALELQLERFFTVWAWRWDLEEDMDFADHLGVPLHPLHRTLSHILDAFSQEHLESFVTFLLIPPYVVPSTGLIESGYPSVLINHILSRIPPPPVPSQEPLDARPSSAEEKPATELAVTHTPKANNMNDTIRAVTPFMNMNMDMRTLKWMWNGLTFSKTPSTRPAAPPTPSIPATEQQDPPPSQETKPQDTLAIPQRADVEVDAESLREAISSEFEGMVSNLPSPTRPELVPLPSSPVGSMPDIGGVDVLFNGSSAVKPDDNTPRVPQDVQVDRSETPGEESGATGAPEPAPGRSATPVPPPEFLSTIVHLASEDSLQQTVRHKVYHATQGPLTFGVIANEHDPPDLPAIAEKLAGLFAGAEAAMQADERRSDDVVTPVTRILEPQNRHIICTGGYTSSSQSGFSSKSEHLFDGRAQLHNEFDVQEVFSRGQNPQHWHISKRGLGVDQHGRAIEGEVFMEVARKESTLTDVDNELAGVVRHFLE